MAKYFRGISSVKIIQRKHRGPAMYTCPLGIEYHMAVTNLIEPINPALLTPFIIYKDTVQGRKPFPSTPYLFGLFDGLVHQFHPQPADSVIRTRYHKNHRKSLGAWQAGFEEAKEVYEQSVNDLLSVMIDKLPPAIQEELS
ncbi:MAG: hypothetical protein D3916_00955 [Candidatus Electrothrix sp. MAN1_4]|nr:hypothetical protein [Candidatus Electrothrix sp. MAN1_4]